MGMRFDQQLVSRLEKLRLMARRRSPRGTLGTHRSSRRGSGVEPAGHRPYAPGDDFRRIDWNAFRRLERLYVTEREEETERTVVLVLDRSSSMEGAKLDTGRLLVASLAHVALAEGDAVRLLAFAGDEVQALEPRRGQAAIFALLRFLDGLEAKGGTKVATACAKAARGPVRPGLAVLVTDFLDAAPAREALVTLAAGGRDTVLVHLVAPEDERCDFAGSRRLVDAETGEELLLDFDAHARDDYARAFAEWTRGLEASARSLGCAYVRIRTDEPFESSVLQLLAKRGVLA